jgi:long-chain acyl-CoA synthetase
MKRAVLCVPNPQDYIDQLVNYSIMIINPVTPLDRLQYLLNNSDYSLRITPAGYDERDGSDYPNEKIFWYTSGTTGDSKFYSFTQEQIDHSANTVINAYNLTENDRYVSIMGLWHAHGAGFYWAAKHAGCEMNFLSVKELRNLPKFSPTFITAFPNLLKAATNLKLDSNLRFLRTAGAPLPDSMYLELKQKFSIPIIQAMGMTETIGHCFTNPLHGEQRIGTIGLPSGIEAKIDNSKLSVRGVYTNNWIETGDLAEQDDAGYYRILGRYKDQINVNGIKLNPISLETQLLTAVTSIEDCVIFGTDTVKCLYTGNCNASDISTFLTSLGAHCRPKLLQHVDVIPLSPSGKVSRTYLETLF